MRIMILSENILPLLLGKSGVHGGAELQLYVLAKELSKNNHDVHIITCKKGEAAEVLHNTNMKIYMMLDDSSKSKLAHLKNMVRLLRMINDIDRQEVIITRGGTPLLFILSIIARVTGSSFVYSLSSNRNAEELQWGWKEIRRKRGSYIGEKLYALGILLADAIIAQTHAQRKIFLNSLRKQIKVIPNFYPLDTKEGAKEASNSSSGKYVLWVGRIHPEKNPQDFVYLARMLPHLKFLLVGIPQDKKIYEELQRAAREMSNFRILESVPHAEIHKIYTDALILVNTSDMEGLPNIFLEAWSMGIPVVTKWEDPDNIIEKYKLGKYCLTTECIKEYIQYISANPKIYKKLSVTTKRYVTLKYDRQMILNKYLRLFNSLKGGLG